MSQQFTCNSCGLAFPAAQDQRDHMKTEWHRYNLKRRVASLPPITEEMFNSKVSSMSNEAGGDAANGDNNDDSNGKSEKNRTITKKEQRKREKEALMEKKRQLLELAKQKMANSGGVLEMDDNGKIIMTGKSNEESQIQQQPEEEESQQPEEINETEQQTQEELEEKLIQLKLKNKVDIPPEACLFCTRTFPYQEETIKHMFKKHGLYIPEANYLVDKAGLIQYLSEKIGYGNVCLVCNYQGKDLQAVRQHMITKSHCKIPYESEDEKLEISDFYDFSKSYKDVDGDDEDWEDVDEDDESGEGDGEEEEEEEYLPQEVSYVNNLELHLPNGEKLGHRSLSRYYRQSFKPDRELTEGQGTLIAAETRHFIDNPLTKQEIMSQKRIWKNERKANDTNDRRAQKFINHKEHYRDQLLQ